LSLESIRRRRGLEEEEEEEEEEEGILLEPIFRWLRV